MSKHAIDDTRTGTRRGRGVRLAGTALTTFGLLTAAVGPVIIIAADPAATPFVLPFLILPLVAAALAWAFGAWSKILGGLVGLALLASTVAGPAGWGLRHPTSFFDFLPAVLFAVGGLVAVVGAVLALTGRGSARPWVEGRERGLALTALGAIGVAAAVSAVVTLTGGTTLAPDALAAADAQVIVDESGFDPADLSLPPGEATIAVVNEGLFVHTFTSAELGVDAIVAPGDAVLVTVDVPATESPVQFICTPHSEQGDDGTYDGMVGEIAIGG